MFKRMESIECKLNPDKKMKGKKKDRDIIKIVTSAPSSEYRK